MKHWTFVCILFGLLMGIVVSLINSYNRDDKVATSPNYLIVAEDTLFYKDEGSMTFEEYWNMKKHTYIYNGEIGVAHNEMLPPKGLVQSASDAALIADAYIRFAFGQTVSSVSQPYIVEDKDSFWTVMSKCVLGHNRGCAMMTIKKNDGFSDVFIRKEDSNI